MHGILLFSGNSRRYGLNMKCFRIGCLVLVAFFLLGAVAVWKICIATPANVAHYRELVRTRKVNQAQRILFDLKVINAAIDRYTIKHNLPSGTIIDFEDLQAELKQLPGFANFNNIDLLGNQFNNGEPYRAETFPMVNFVTAQALSDSVEAKFWSPFY